MLRKIGNDEEIEVFSLGEIMKKPLIVLTGPTAVGKTKLSISLAKAVGGEIISADSMQVYKHMDIGSAKIRPEEMKGVPHYLVDVLEPEEEFHIVKFQQMAKAAMEEIYGKGKIPILVGGTGFYIPFRAGNPCRKKRCRVSSRNAAKSRSDKCRIYSCP